MNQVLLYSIQPQHALNILNGIKTIEVRKRDLPQWAKDKLAKGEKVVGYMYVTKGKPYLNKDTGNWFLLRGIDYIGYPVINGLVVAKFEVSGSEKFDSCLGHPKLYIKACLQDEEVYKYGNGADLYAHLLTNVQAIEPIKLSKFYSFRDEKHYNYVAISKNVAEGYRQTYIEMLRLKHSPQSFQTVWMEEEKV